MNFGTANGDNHYDGDGYKLYHIISNLETTIVDDNKNWTISLKSKKWLVTYDSNVTNDSNLMIHKDLMNNNSSDNSSLTLFRNTEIFHHKITFFIHIIFR